MRGLKKEREENDTFSYNCKLHQETLKERMQLGKALIITGSVLMVLGLLVWGGASLGLSFRLGRLPGDIRYEGKGFSFYFPLTSSILISLLLSFFFYLWGKYKS
jgi:hypothetical protein